MKCENCVEKLECDKVTDEDIVCFNFEKAKYKKEKDCGICKECGATRKRRLSGGYGLQVTNWKNLSDEVREVELKKMMDCKPCHDWMSSFTKPKTKKQIARDARIKELQEAFRVIEDCGYAMNNSYHYNYKDLKTRIDKVEVAMKTIKRLSKYSNGGR